MFSVDWGWHKRSKQFALLALIATLVMQNAFAHESTWQRRAEDSESSEPSLQKSQDPTSSPSSSLVPTATMMPSLLPTLGPTITPGPTRTSPPSTQPSVSQSPSASPSYEPTETSAPSPSPSNFPTLYPTQTPQPSPSPSLSLVPSVPPSDYPSLAPSVSPTNFPTTSPSSFPTSVPTLECHDVAEYRSPINAFECVDHAGTDCTMWRHLGLNTTELLQLVESCPVSCQIDCGTFVSVETSLTIILSGLPGLLDIDTQVPLERTVQSYSKVYVEGNQSGSTLELTDVVLKSQALVGRSRMRGRRLGRSLGSPNGESSDVSVKVNLMGFSIGVTQSLLQRLLEQSVDSEGFTEALQDSHVFFAHVEALSEGNYQPEDVAITSDSSESGPSAAIVVVSVLVVVLFVGGGAAGAYVYRKNGGRLSALLPFHLRKETHPEIGPSGSESGSFAYRARSPESSTGTSRTPQQGNLYVSRLLRSISRSPRDSDSPGSTAENTPPSTMGKEQQGSHDVKQAHPLARIIPPMIVIDNIDSDESSSLHTSRDDGNGVVPIKHVEASKGFAEALNSSYASDAASGITDMLYNYSSFGEGRGGGLLSPKERALIEIFSDDPFEDDASVSSTPIKGTEMNVDVPVRQTLSDGSVEDLGVAEVLEELMRSEWEEFDTSMHSTLSDLTMKRSSTPNRRSSRQTMSTIEGEISVTPTRMTIAEAKSSKRKPERANRHSFDATIGSSLGRVTSSLSPIRKRKPHDFPPRGNIPPPPILSSSDSKSRVQASKPKRRSNSLSAHPQAILSSSDSTSRVHSSKPQRRSSSLSAHERLPSDEIQYTFQAPTNAKLGLVIESSRSRGSYINSVKDYSPLLGLIQVGDRIVLVDGVSTLKMGTHDLLSLLGRKRGTIGTIQIRVSRTLGTTSIATIPSMRGGGHNKSDSGSLSTQSLGRLHGKETSDREIVHSPDSETSW